MCYVDYGLDQTNTSYSALFVSFLCIHKHTPLRHVRTVGGIVFLCGLAFTINVIMSPSCLTGDTNS